MAWTYSSLIKLFFFGCVQFLLFFGLGDFFFVLVVFNFVSILQTELPWPLADKSLYICTNISLGRLFVRRRNAAKLLSINIAPDISLIVYVSAYFTRDLPTSHIIVYFNFCQLEWWEIWHLVGLLIFISTITLVRLSILHFLGHYIFTIMCKGLQCEF